MSFESSRIRGVHGVTHAAARVARRNMTPSEALLWSRLQSRQLDGFKFRAQHARERFIFDFVCLEGRLVVEVDGGIHLNPERKTQDEYRDDVTGKTKLRVLRLRADDVELDVETALRAIRAALPATSRGRQPKRKLPEALPSRFS